MRVLSDSRRWLRSAVSSAAAKVVSSCEESDAILLRQSEERARLRYEMTPLPLHSMGANGDIVQVSDAWLELLGYEREEVVGRPLTFFMTAESATRRRQDWARLISEGAVRDLEYSLVTKTGQILDVVCSSRADTDEHGQFSGAVGGLIDVTARKRAEAALRQSQKIEAVGQLTGGVAHDFNNLLAVVLGNLELLRKRIPDDPRCTRLIDSAMQAGHRGAALTQRMLSFARRQDLKPASVDLRNLVHGMDNLIQNAVGSEIVVDLQFPDALSLAEVDANQLELSLVNLAVNSRDAMPDGGRLTIAAREKSVLFGEVDGLKAGDYICLSVQDNGTGMDEGTLMRAREPFFTTKGVGKGTGLGLSMVHGLAEQTGGGLVLMSREGVGTTAEIWLPVSIQVPLGPSPVVSSTGDVAAVSPMRVLVVDDDALVLANTTEVLEDLGHTVVQASSGIEGLEIFRKDGRFDLVMTDQAMPQMTGVQFAERLRDIDPAQPIILASGYAEIPEGSGRHLPRLRKPYQQATMLRMIAQIVPSKVVRSPSLDQAEMA